MTIIGFGVAIRFVFLRLADQLGEAKPGPAYLHELEENRAAGLPVTPADMKHTPIPESLNAAPIYLQLVDLLKKKPLSKQDEERVYRLSVPGPLAKEEMESGRQVLADRPDISDLVHRAVSRPDCDFDRDYALGPALATPEFGKMRLAARWVAGEASILARDGKTKEAIKYAESGFNIGRQLSHDPTLIGYLVSLSADTFCLEALQAILYLAADRSTIAEAVRQAIADKWKVNSLSHALKGELVLTAVIVDNFRRYGPRYGKALAGEPDTGTDTSTYLGQAAVNWPVFIDNNGILMLKSLRELIAVSDQPYPESHARAVSITNDIENSGAKAILARNLFTVYDDVIAKRAASLGKVRVVTAAAAILAYKQKHGDFPENLKVAMKPAPVDPFDLGPLHYRREGKGFVVYSVGPTGKFDGHPKDKKQYNQEAVFRYTAPGFPAAPVH